MIPVKRTPLLSRKQGNLVKAQTVDAMIGQHEELVGFWGAPPGELLDDLASHFGRALVDLDVYYGAPSAGLVPDPYCHIIRNCVDNAAALKSHLKCIVAATGKEKCDAGRYAAWLVSSALSIEVIESENTVVDPLRSAVLCDTSGPLKKRVIRIMDSIVVPFGDEELTRAGENTFPPTHGFWGTPPHPIELLDLFPETTRIFGWTRCVEQGCPANLELELWVPDDLPIVFFSQGFCPKAQLARRLAEENKGMHVDLHDALNAATQAKIEAFIRLSAPRGTR